jgi:hypothetical protein
VTRGATAAARNGETVANVANAVNVAHAVAAMAVMDARAKAGADAARRVPTARDAIRARVGRPAVDATARVMVAGPKAQWRPNPTRC